jgi:hypothetical protein
MGALTTGRTTAQADPQQAMKSIVEPSRKREKTGGRKAGTVNKKTAATVDAVESSGLTPLEYMLSVMRSDIAEPRERLSAAMSAAPYVHAKLSSIEVSGKGGGVMEMNVNVNFD